MGGIMHSSEIKNHQQWFPVIGIAILFQIVLVAFLSFWRVPEASLLRTLALLS
jgi:hypothetical protein